MNDFNYMQKAVDLDRRLEAAMESHKPEPAKVAESGLVGFVERPTIAEEIASLKKTAVDLNIERAKEQLDALVEKKASGFDAFLEAVKTAGAEHLAEVQSQAEIDNHLAALRGAR